MTMDGKPYGTWNFAVKGGQLVYTGPTAPGSDPLTRVEGGLDAWWYKEIACPGNRPKDFC